MKKKATTKGVAKAARPAVPPEAADITKLISSIEDGGTFKVDPINGRYHPLAKSLAQFILTVADGKPFRRLTLAVMADAFGLTVPPTLTREQAAVLAVEILARVIRGGRAEILRDIAELDPENPNGWEHREVQMAVMCSLENPAASAKDLIAYAKARGHVIELRHAQNLTAATRSKPGKPGRPKQ